MSCLSWFVLFGLIFNVSQDTFKPIHQILDVILGDHNFHMGIRDIYSRLWRSSTARGSCTGLVTVDPTKIYIFICNGWNVKEQDH